MRCCLSIGAAVLLVAGLGRAAEPEPARHHATKPGAQPDPELVLLEDAEPASAGLISDAALDVSNALFAEQRWEEAAEFLQRKLSRAVERADQNRQIAEYQLGVALFRMGYHVASYSVLSAAAGDRTHARFAEALPWLVRLLVLLPEPSQIAERLRLYDDDAIESELRKIDARQSAARLKLGRSELERDRRAQALRQFAQVAAVSPEWPEAHELAGICLLRLGRPQSALRAFELVEQRATGSNAPRLRDRANLMIGRIHLSRGFTARSGALGVDRRALGTARARLSRVSIQGQDAAEALGELARAELMAGDDAAALGTLQTLEAPYVSGVRDELRLLRAAIYFRNCHHAAARYELERGAIGLERQLRTLELVQQQLAYRKRERELVSFAKVVRAHPLQAPAALARMLRPALLSREFTGHSAYLETIERELYRLTSQPKLRGTPLGLEIGDALRLAQDLGIRSAADMLTKHFHERIAELRHALRKTHELGSRRELRNVAPSDRSPKW